jgi:hypothetical protein
MLSIFIGDALSNYNDHTINNLTMPEYYTFSPAVISGNACALGVKRVMENLSLHQSLKQKYSTQYQQEFTESQLKIMHENIFKDEFKDLISQYINLDYGKMFRLWIVSNYETRISSLSNDIFSHVCPIILTHSSLETMHYMIDCIVNIAYCHPKSLEVAHQYIDLLYVCKSNEESLWKIKSLKIATENTGLQIKTIKQYEDLKGFHFLAPVTLCRALACVIESTNFKEVIHNLIRIKADNYTFITACTFAELIYGIDIEYLEKLPHYFGFYHYNLLKNILSLYKNKVINEHVSSEKHQQWYNVTYNTQLVDPTALFDPLEEVSEDDYYSDYEKKMIKMNQPWWKKIVQTILLRP